MTPGQLMGLSAQPKREPTFASLEDAAAFYTAQKRAEIEPPCST